MFGRQHSTYQEFQPTTNRYGPQYTEPGGYAQNQQRNNNMTQREDVLKFEQGRIKALQEERLHIQKKTFTKWMNSFLQKARMEVDDLFVDLADGKKLLKLLEIISGEKLGRPNNGRMRVHKIENVNKSLAFLHTKVRLESIGAEDIVDGNPRLILGLIWTIILRFQIQEIEIDVDEENESSEKKSAKDALLLWCQRKTNGYHGVHISNFTDSWRTGLGFNALIHAHRPDLFDYKQLPGCSNMENLNHAFDVAHLQLGIPKLLDAEDVDTSRPDEKSVITYVASYYHTFARMKSEQKIGRRIANIVNQLMDADEKKRYYSRIFTTLLEWIKKMIDELGDRSFPNSLDGIQQLLIAFKQYRTVEKPPKYKERVEIEALFFHINTVAKSLWRSAFTPAEGQLPVELERAWRQLEAAEHQREVALRDELLRQQRLEHLNYKFNTKAVLRDGYLKEMIQVLKDPRYGSNTAQVDATVKKHEAISADILARRERFEDLKAMAEELVKENYHGADAVEATAKRVLDGWEELLDHLRRHQEALNSLSGLMSLLREVDTALGSVNQLKAQFISDDVGPHLTAVEEAAQQLALQELQLSALGETSRKLARQCAALPPPTTSAHENPRQLLEQRLTQLQTEYNELVAAAEEKKIRLEYARNLYQFIEDHEEEESWVTERQRICRAGVSVKDLRAVLSLQQKHKALIHEMRARERHTAKVVSKGNSLIEDKHPKSAEISKRLENLENHWKQLRELADLREKQLREAAEAYQFYADANEAESWLKEKLSLVSSADLGNDQPSAQALLSRHRTLQGELAAYKPELASLNTQADRLIDQGINSLQLTSEPDQANVDVDGEEWVNETRLVPTEVWEEEPVERLEHKTVVEDRSVPQVKALYPFTGQGMVMNKGETMLLMNKTNPDWWSVRKADGTDGFVPANYVREIEPRIVPVQVRRAEKVRSVQRVKKTVLMKQTVRVRQPTRRRPSQRPQPLAVTPEDSVDDRRQRINTTYEHLLKLAADRHIALEDAIRLYAFYGDCDDLERWIKDKEKLLKTEDPNDTVDAAKRKHEKFVTDMSTSSSRLTEIDAAVQELTKQKHPQIEKVTARAAQIHRLWDNLNRLKALKEKNLEGASSVELFERTCEEVREWTQEKNRQLEADEHGADLHTVRALQRRHAQLERELAPLKEKVERVHLLAENVKSSYPSERTNVETRQKEIQKMWEECEEKAREKRARLENAVGQQIFNKNGSNLLSWIQSVREQLAAEVTAKDVATAEALIKQHNDLLDDINTHKDELDEVIALGEKLVKNNPKLTDVAEKIEALKLGRKAIDEEWKKKNEFLKQCLQLQMFNREADRIDASTGAHEAFLEFQDLGDSIEAVEALVKRHEDFENTLAAQDDRLRGFYTLADSLVKEKHYATEHIIPRTEQVRDRREAVKLLATDRRRQLQTALAYQHFIAEADDLDGFIQDKMRLATDQSYKDLTNLERKLQKHEAFERELHANEAQLSKVTNTGEALILSEPSKEGAVSSRLGELRNKWAALRHAAAERGKGLRQASAQRDHAKAAQDARDRLESLKRSLEGEVTAKDLRTCKDLLNKHQALELEISQWRQRIQELETTGDHLAAEGHFDADNVKAESKRTLQALEDLADPMAKRRAMLEERLKFHKFKFSLDAELQWISERMGAAASETVGNDLHAAQGLHKKHKKLLAEIAGHHPSVVRTLDRGNELIKEELPDKQKIVELCKELEKSWTALESAAEARGTKLDQSLKAQQFLQDALDVDSWIENRRNALSSKDYGRDRDHAMQLLTRHKAIELELDTYAGIVSEMEHGAQAMSSANFADAPALLEKYALLTQSMKELQKLGVVRQKGLVESLCRHEYLVESAELERWIQEQYAIALSEDYGQDYEHLLILQSKFDELRYRVETGSDRFSQCEELAKKLVMSESPYIPDIEKTQEQLGKMKYHEESEAVAEVKQHRKTLCESWQKLVDQIGRRAERLKGAGDIHRFHRDATDALGRLQEKWAILSEQPEPTRDLNAAEMLLRRHEGLENDLLALDAQIQMLSEEAGQLQQRYPGSNKDHIEQRQQALQSSWQALRGAAIDRREHLHAACDLHRFLAQIRDLMSWSTELRATMRAEVPVRDVGGAQALKAEHEAAKAEIEAREDLFHSVLEMGQAMVQTGHTSAPEVEQKCATLLEERQKLHTAWQTRQVALDQLIDLHFFLRDAKQLNHLCQAHEVALSAADVSLSSTVEEVDAHLKKHDAFEKLLNTQEEKIAALNSHGAKLLQQHHPNSEIISTEQENVNERRKKVRELCALKRNALDDALLHAQFTRDVAETQFWIQDKMKKLDIDQAGEVTNLEDKIKRLQKHQAFQAELAANEGRVSELRELAKKLIERPGRAQNRTIRDAMDRLQHDWLQLLHRAEQTGRGLEEAQDILEFNNQVDKIEAWIRHKEMMVQAADTGRDYEHCSALLRKLDDLDSDMRVDDKHIRKISALADKLVQEGQTSGPAITERRDAFLNKWHALTGALQEYRNNLTAALEIHKYNRDVQDTIERAAEKAALLNSGETVKDLRGVERLQRRRDALHRDATAVRQKMDSHAKDAQILISKYPTKQKEIVSRLDELQQSWEQLQHQLEQRREQLDNAYTIHKFDADLKELELWNSEAVKKIDNIQLPTNASEAEQLLELHQEHKVEIDSRQKTIENLQREAECLPLPEDEDVYKRPKRLAELSNGLHKAWENQKDYLTQAHQLQLFKEQARQTEDWLSAKEAFLNNDDLGDSLPAVEALLRKHGEFNKLILAQQAGRADELRKFADELLSDNHYDKDYIDNRLTAIENRLDKLKEKSEDREQMLEQSLQLQQFLRDLYHEHEWIALKAQVANDQNYNDLSNLQSKIQRHTAFESELLANKDRIHAVIYNGEELIKNDHYAANEIGEHNAGLENDWATLQEAAAEKRERLNAAYQARVFLRTLEDFTVWIDDVESHLQSDDHGKDLASVGALLARHTRLEQDVAQRGDECIHLRETASQLEIARNFMAEEINERVNSAIYRYRQLQEPLQIRRDNLEDAQLLQRWLRDADEEISWLHERAPIASAPVVASSLTHAHNLLKKHNALEVELLAREPIVASLTARASQMQLRRHFGSEQLEKITTELQDTLRQIKENAAVRKLKLQDAVDMHMFTAEAAEAETWLAEKKPLLQNNDNGRDEDSVTALQRRLEVIQREIGTFDKQVNKVESLANALEARKAEGSSEAMDRSKAIRKSLEELTLLGAKRQQRLQDSDKYFKFVRECEEVNEWINDQTTVAASEDYGIDVEHVEILIQAFDNFIAGLSANEGRVEGIVESGQRLLDERTPEAENVKARVADTRSQWEDLRELANARQDALTGAKQVHVFDRTADETIAWIAEKDSALNSELSVTGSDVHATQALSKKYDSLEADTAAVKSQVEQLRIEANRLSETFPDAKDHVSDKLEETTESLDELLNKISVSRDKLQQAGQVQAYFDEFSELSAWISEMLARITAPELAMDVPGAEQLLSRHSELKTEIDARLEDFTKFYKKGENLIAQKHFLAKEIDENMSFIKHRFQLLHETWKDRHTVYEHHLDCLIFKRDADMLENWIDTREPQIRDGKLGDSVPQVEDLIKKHEDFQNTIEAQQDKFNALKRMTMVEKAFKEQQDKEAEARRAERERQERERLENRRAIERARIEEKRRFEEQSRSRDHLAHPIVEPTSPNSSITQSPNAGYPPVVSPKLPPQPIYTSPVSVQKSNSTAQILADRLKKATNIKRAESMKPDTIADQDNNKIAGIKSPGLKDSGKPTKRTPSFNTRRRTQSFRKAQRGDPSDLPPVEIDGYLERKHELGNGGKRAAVRSWRMYYTVLCGQLLCFFKDEADFAQSKAAAPPVVILKAQCDRADFYTKRKNVFQLRCTDGAQFLFSCDTKELLDDWVKKIDFHAKLPPSLQLSSYENQGDKHIIQKPKDGNVSSGSSITSSPEPRTRTKTQAEILAQHRNSKQPSGIPNTPPTPPRTSTLPDSPNKQSPPAVPPRLPPASPNNNVPVLRNPEQHMGNGASRPMSEQVISAAPRNQNWRSSHQPNNNYDVNTAFIQSQQYAENLPPPLPQTLPPTSRRPLQFDHMHHHQHHNDGGDDWQLHRQRILSNNNNINRPLSQTSWNDTTTATAQFYTASDYAYQQGSSNTGTAESSGESELSVSGVSDKKDKKGGVLSSFFRRKKHSNSSHTSSS